MSHVIKRLNVLTIVSDNLFDFGSNFKTCFKKSFNLFHNLFDHREKPFYFYPICITI
jgi:hypothetical protein